MLRMISRFWYRLRVYLGFAAGPDELLRDDFGVGGISAGGELGMGAAVLIGVDSIAAALAALGLGSLLGWGTVKRGRTRSRR